MKPSSITPIALFSVLACVTIAGKAHTEEVDAASLPGKVMCGYQGWFRCPRDAGNLGWVHWSRDGRQIAPETLSFEMWPDMAEYGSKERFPAPGFTYPDVAKLTRMRAVVHRAELEGSP
jgi:hypothetical protein